MSNINELQGVQKNTVSSSPAFPHGWRERGTLGGCAANGKIQWLEGERRNNRKYSAALTHAEGL